MLALMEQLCSPRESIGVIGGLLRTAGLRATFLPMIDEATIAEAGRRISAAAPGARVILFGSHARAEADPKSDLDLLVIVDTPHDRQYKLNRECPRRAHQPHE